jgi:hypothetical protein
MGLWGIDSWRFRKQCGEQPSSGGYVVSWVCILCSVNVWKCMWGMSAWYVNFWIQFV